MSASNSHGDDWPGTVGVVSRLPQQDGRSRRPWVCLRVPAVGERLVLFDGRPGTYVVTSAVRRIFEAGPILYVQTLNSVYRVALLPTCAVDQEEFEAVAAEVTRRWPGRTTC